MRGRTVLLLVLVIVIAAAGIGYYLLQNGQILNNGNPVAGNTTTNTNGATAAPIVLTATPIRLVQVVVAVQELPRGIRIPRDGIGIQPFPIDNVPALAVTIEDPKNPDATLNKVVGQIARTDIARLEPILYTTLVDDITKIAKTGSDAALVVPSGLRAISVPVDRFTATAFALHDGDYVDVIGSFLYTDVDQGFQARLPNKLNLIVITSDATGGQKVTFLGLPSGRFEAVSLVGQTFAVAVQPSESQRPRLATQLVIQSALVVHLGTFPLSGGFIGVTPTSVAPPADQAQSGAAASGSNATQPPTPTLALPDVITVAVSPQDANVLTWMMDARVPMTFTLHNPQDLGRTSTQEVTLAYMVQTYGVVEPLGLPYALEPPIRSIRSLTSSTLVPFEDPNYGGSSTTGG